jgi:natural product biosynthesis luciferase-like monooxygenase protein
MQFGLMFFCAGRERRAGKYDLLLEAARYADRHGFAAVWTPERHFHAFGGLFPNPSVTGAALAVATSRVQIRAGSLISPLHHTVRIAEEWSVVDNLSNGRTAISFGSGWNRADFTFFPDRYDSRHRVMYEQIAAIRGLWRGEPVELRNAQGRLAPVRIYPRPVQPELPIWITSSGNPETFVSAGRLGANLLTHMLGQDIPDLAARIDRYRDALEESGYERSHGLVTVMLHTFVGRDTAAVRERVRQPFREYLRCAVNLEEMAARAGGSVSGGHHMDPAPVPPDALEQLLDRAFDRYFTSASLLGSPAKCEAMVRELKCIGVDEIACLIDFLDDTETVLEHLPYLESVRSAVSREEACAFARTAAESFSEPLV